MKGSPNNHCNYRPISITCVTGKLEESILKEHIVAHFYNHKLISKQQHGFLARRSTTTRLHNCCRNWSVCIKSNKPVDVIYLDFAKVFDSVVHNKLLYKLKLNRINNMILKWLGNFLSGRLQCVRVATSFSKFCQYLMGYHKEESSDPYCF